MLESSLSVSTKFFLLDLSLLLARVNSSADGRMNGCMTVGRAGLLIMTGGGGVGPLEVVMAVAPEFAKLFIADTSGDEAAKFAFFTTRKF
jgi:hypothetical protein